MPTNPDAGGNILGAARYANELVNYGETKVITVEYGQTAQFQAASIDANLNGAHVVSDKPISLFSGNCLYPTTPTIQHMAKFLPDLRH